jgi:hypothetical protein
MPENARAMECNPLWCALSTQCTRMARTRNKRIRVAVVVMPARLVVRRRMKPPTPMLMRVKVIHTPAGKNGNDEMENRGDGR